ncbi:MAG: thioesterase domain-containing protein [Cyclobacteriaceae bacterium]
MSRIKLFSFPYAGGSSIVFRNWQPYLDSSVEIIPIELAGRGKRIKDPLYQDLEELIDDVYDHIKIQTDERYALFGHSLGGLIVYELAHKLCKEGFLPEHIFFSGRGAPNVKDKKNRDYHLLSDKDFKKEVFELGGTAPEFFQHPELMEMFIPLLRNDFKLASVNFEDRAIDPFECDISAFIGKDEDITPEQVYSWKDHSLGVCSIHSFNGGHFFLHDEFANICRIINRTLIVQTI